MLKLLALDGFYFLQALRSPNILYVDAYVAVLLWYYNHLCRVCYIVGTRFEFEMNQDLLGEFCFSQE